MNRLPLFLPILIALVISPVSSVFEASASPAAAVGGAAFTTVDQAVDGAGHCANGNPRVNCNIYDVKESVWLKGGPASAVLKPDGQYFFAVLAPSGQPSANDGTQKNLSDDYDTYQNRTFTVSGGKVSAYSGSHWFDSGAHALGPADGKAPFIRLFPFADTPNQGGVYILAICSLAKGYPVKAKDCKFDQFKVASLATATPTNTPTPTDTSVVTVTVTPTNT